MADVYSFEASENIESYEQLKQTLGYTSWNIDVNESKMCVLVDGTDINEKFKDVIPGFKFGEVIKAEEIGCDQNCIQLHGTHDSVILTLGDYYPPASTFGARIECASVQAFCDSLDKEMTMWRSTRNLSTDKSGNVFLKGAEEKGVGIFKVPLKQLVTATKTANSIRAHSESIVNKFVSQWKIDIKNGRIIQLPTAIGLVKNPENPLSGEQVEIIDGNHTVLAAKRLLEELPEANFLKERHVMLYHNLSTKEVLTLALLRNEEVGNTNPTTELDKIRLMRRELTNHNGTLTKASLAHLYEIFNCICPTNKKEENRRKKYLNPLARLATMDSRVWSLVEDIETIQGGRKMYKYRFLSMASISDAISLLQKIKNGSEKYSSLKTLSQKLPQAKQADTFVLQRIRKPPKATKSQQNLEPERDENFEPVEDDAIEQNVPLKRNPSSSVEFGSKNETEATREEVRNTRKRLSETEQQLEALETVKIELDEALAEKASLEEQIRLIKGNSDKKDVALPSSGNEPVVLSIGETDIAKSSRFEDFVDLSVEEKNNLPFSVVSHPPGLSKYTPVVSCNNKGSSKGTSTSRKRNRNETLNIGDDVEALWINKSPQFKKWYRAEIILEVKKGEMYKVRFYEDGFQQVLNMDRIRKIND